MIKVLDLGIRQLFRVPAVLALGLLLLAGSLTVDAPNALAGAPAHPAVAPAQPFAFAIAPAPAAAPIAPAAVQVRPVVVAPVVGLPMRAADSTVRRLAAGVTLTTWKVRTTYASGAGRTVVVRAVTIDPSVADGRLVVAKRPGRTTRTSTLTKSVGGLVGINGSFFSGGRAHGVTVRNGKVVSGHSGYAGERTLLVDSRYNTLQIASLKPSVRKGVKVAAVCKKVDNLGRLRDLRGKVCGAAQRAVRERDGSAVRLSKSTAAIAGRFQLLNDGRIAVRNRSRNLFQRHARTIAGNTSDGRIVLMTISGGVTLRDAARYAATMGMSDALNLDGGGSSSMVVRGKLINRAGSERAVSDALVWKVR